MHWCCAPRGPTNRCDRSRGRIGESWCERRTAAPKPLAPPRGDGALRQGGPMTEITDLDAHALSRAIHAREVSCVEVMRAYLARIQRVNPRFNAIVSLAPDDVLLAQAVERDAELQRGGSCGFLHGMPQAIKDAASAVGFPTTYGSPLMKNNVARVDN